MFVEGLDDNLARDSLFKLHSPGSVPWRKAPQGAPVVNQKRIRPRIHSQSVCVRADRCNVAVQRIVGNHALRVMIEGVNVERNAVVKATISPADYGSAPAKGSPGEAKPRPHAKAVGDALTFEPRSKIERESPLKGPMILCKPRRTEVLDFVCAPVRELNASQKISGEIENIDGMSGELATVRQDVQRAAELQIMSSGPTDLSRRPGLEPLRAPRFAILPGKIIAAGFQ